MKSSVFDRFQWMNKPQKFVSEGDRLLICTEPGTDLWQRTYYGFRNDNAPAFLMEVEGDFTFQVKTEYEEAIQLYDQCGVLLYSDSENWVKVSTENENEQVCRLGSVVTNLGYSDWASVDIPAEQTGMWYRFSRRGQDFYVENSTDGINFQQMRMFHMHKDMPKVKVGVYACSPMESSFNAVFSEFKIGPCIWSEHV